MHVILQPLGAAEGGAVTIETNSSAILSSLISSYCANTGQKFSNKFLLYDEQRRPLPLYSTIATLGIENGTTLLIGIEDPPFSIQNHWPFVIAFVALVIGIIGVFSMAMVYGLKGGEYFDDYGVVMDAGSSKTNTIVYKWRSSKHHGTGRVTQMNNCFAKGGVAKMNPLHLENITKCAMNVTAGIAEEYRWKTPLFLAATAGMRLLDLTDPNKTEEILDHLRLNLPETNLSVKSVAILSGRNEGINGWITINFLLNTLDQPQKSDPREPTTFGAMDMGGASVQISYALPKDVPFNASDDITSLRLYGQNYNVFSQSNLCFGRDEAQNRYNTLLLLEDPDETIIEDPCAPKGYNRNFKTAELFKPICARPENFTTFKNLTHTYVGTSDPKTCREKVSKLLDNSLCTKYGFKECFTSHTNLPEQQKYKAFATFFFTTNFLNVTNSTLEEYENVVNDFCKKDLKEVLDILNSTYSTEYCFNGHYIYTVLINGLGFSATTWENLEFVSEIAEVEVGWTLGYMINATNLIPEKTTPRLISKVTLGISLALFIIMILATAIFLLVKCKLGRGNSGRMV